MRTSYLTMPRKSEYRMLEHRRPEPTTVLVSYSSSPSPRTAWGDRESFDWLTHVWNTEEAGLGRMMVVVEEDVGIHKKIREKLISFTCCKNLFQKNLEMNV